MTISGRASRYKRYDYKTLKLGVELEVPSDAARAYIRAECGTVRWAFSSEEKLDPHPESGMPLQPDDGLLEFTRDLDQLQLWAGNSDAVAHVYYFTST